MILDSTLRKLQVVLSEAKTTNDCPVVSSWFDSGATPNGGPSLANTNGVTAVDIVAAPAANYIRQVNEITVQNSDTISHGVTVRYNDNGTFYTIMKATLAPGYSLVYSKALGWAVMSPTGLFIAGQIPGTATNDSAAPGMVGEPVSQVLPVTSGIALTSLTVTDITSVTFSAGDWDISASMGVTTASTSTMILMRGWLSIVSATQPAVFTSGMTAIDYGAGLAVTGDTVYPVPTTNFSFATPTTVYLTERVQFTGAAMKGYGRIFGRRVR